MPLFIDIHEVPGVTSEIAAAEHIKDLRAIEDTFDCTVNYMKYWLNEASGKVYCMCEAPSAETAIDVHRVAHGGETASRIIEVTPELMELFMGPSLTDTNGAALLPAEFGSAFDPATRTVLCSSPGDADERLAAVTVHDEIVARAVAEAGGREIRRSHDGIMAVFISASAAVRCAVRIQTDVARYSAEHRAASFLVRIGIAAGEPVGPGNDLFGATVQMAARLCVRARPAQIVVLDVVKDLCIGKRITFAPLAIRPGGENMFESVNLYAVEYQ